jgi:hypothetical protein
MQKSNTYTYADWYQLIADSEARGINPADIWPGITWDSLRDLVVWHEACYRANLGAATTYPPAIDVPSGPIPAHEPTDYSAPYAQGAGTGRKLSAGAPRRATVQSGWRDRPLSHGGRAQCIGRVLTHAALVQQLRQLARHESSVAYWERRARKVRNNERNRKRRDRRNRKRMFDNI